MSHMTSILSVQVAAALLTVCVLGAPSTSRAQALAKTVTFTKDVAPILQRSCQACHRPGSIGPMSLLTYEDARPWARAIEKNVVSRSMPPWYLDKTIGIQKFKGDRSLSDDEIATIVQWVKNGAPRGNPADMPAPVKFPDSSKWTGIAVLGREPDLIVEMPETYSVAPKNANQWMTFYAPTGLKEDRWIQAIETKPSVEGFPAVHHASLWFWKDWQNGEGEQEWLSEYGVGKTADINPPGTARLLGASWKLRFNMHYASPPNGKAATDRTSVAFWLYPKGFTPKHTIVRAVVGGVNDLDLPPGEDNIRHDGYTVLKENTRIVAIQPHMHNRGKRQCIEAIYPTGRVETLNCIGWNFGWHIVYNYEDDVSPLLPKGTILHTISWHDNSATNKTNPDPRNWAGHGQRSSDDMAFTHMTWYTMSDDEFKAEIKARIEKMQSATQVAGTKR